MTDRSLTQGRWVLKACGFFVVRCGAVVLTLGLLLGSPAAAQSANNDTAPADGCVTLGDNASPDGRARNAVILRGLCDGSVTAADLCDCERVDLDRPQHCRTSHTEVVLEASFLIEDGLCRLDGASGGGF